MEQIQLKTISTQINKMINKIKQIKNGGATQSNK